MYTRLATSLYRPAHTIPIMNVLRAASRARIPAARAVRHPQTSTLARYFYRSAVRFDSTPEEKQDKIIQILKEKFAPTDLQVQDISGVYGTG